MIGALSSGGLITNYNCSAACRHCLYKSSPRRDKTYMGEELLRSLLAKGKSLGCSSYHIGGGEPLLNREGLFLVLEIMAEEGVSVDYLETNASWFRDDESARILIGGLADRGCGTVMVSVCPFHNEFIPLKKMEGAMKACQEGGMGLFIWQEQYYRHLAALEKDETHSFEEMSSVWGGDYLLKTGRRFGLTMGGRALETFRDYLPFMEADGVIAENGGGCGELEETGHFHFDLYGNFIPPGCVGLQVDHRDLGKELSPEDYPHYRILREKGVGGLYEMAAQKGFEPREKGYVTKCDLCGHIRAFIMENEGGAPGKDLGPLEYYTKD